MRRAGLTPIKLFLDERNVRAWPGGVGDCKVGSNYAPTIRPQMAAQQAYGTPQVLAQPLGLVPHHTCSSLNRHTLCWGHCKFGSGYVPTIGPQMAAQQAYGTPQVCFLL